MTASVPPLGRCQLCGHRRRLSPHTSTRDRLVRLLCTACFSSATLAEEGGHPIDWQQAMATCSDEELARLLDGAL